MTSSVSAQIRTRLAKTAGGVLAAVVAVALIVLLSLYLLAFEQRRDRLLENAHNLASIAEAVAQYDRHALEDSDAAWQATVSQLQDGFDPVISEKMEVVLGRRAGQQIEFVWRQRKGTGPKTVAWDSHLAGPMRSALSGQSGVVVDIDYDGRDVLAAYGAIPTLGLGLVLKEDLATIRRPYIYAGLIILCAGLVLSVLGRFGFCRFVDPMIMAIADNEEKFRDLVENSPDIIWEVDAEGRYSYIGPRCEDILGYSPDELIGKTPFFHMSPDEGERVSALFFQFADEKRPFRRVKNTYLHKDGHDVILETSGNPLFDGTGILIGFRGVGRDISRRMAAESELLAEKQRAEHYLDIAGNMFVALDEEGCITLVNHKACEVLGYDEQELIGKNWFQHCLPQDINADVFDVFKQLVSGDVEAVEYFENDVLTKYGERRMISWHNSVITAQNDKISGILSSGEDITDRKELERNLLQSQKLDALGTLAGGIAHDINNMLLPIMSLTEMSLRDTPVESRVHLRLQKVLEAANRAKELIDGILAFSHREDLGAALKETDISDLVNETLNLIITMAPSTINIVQNIDPGCGVVRLVPAQVSSALVNLCSNAFDAMEGEVGTLTVSLAPIYLSKEQGQTFEDIEPGEYAHLSVQDTGTGIKQEVLDHIFDPFYTTKEVGEGTGLGMSITQGIIKKHGGDIRVTSQFGEGTTIDVYLPLLEAASNPNQERQFSMSASGH